MKPSVYEAGETEIEGKCCVFLPVRSSFSYGEVAGSKHKTLIGYWMPVIALVDCQRVLFGYVSSSCPSSSVDGGTIKIGHVCDMI